MKLQEIELDLKTFLKILQPSLSELNKIDYFKEGFNSEVQEFSSFKQGYRNTVGKVYEEVHKKIPEGVKRAQFKFKIFCCHLINRVFKTGVKR